MEEHLNNVMSYTMIYVNWCKVESDLDENLEICRGW